MFTSRLLVGTAFAILLAMVWIDWNFPTEMFYAPIVPRNETVSNLLLFKKSIEIGLSLLLAATGAVVLFRPQNGITERLLAGVALGVGLGFWLHRDLVYLLLN